MLRSRRTFASLFELGGGAYAVSEIGCPALNVYVYGVAPRSTNESYGRLSSDVKPVFIRCAPARYVIEKRCLNGRCPVRNRTGPLPLNGKGSAVSRYRRLVGMPAHRLSKVLAHELKSSTPPSNSRRLVAVLFHVPINSCGWLQYGLPDSIDETPAFR